jgi:hypothetical protein
MTRGVRQISMLADRRRFLLSASSAAFLALTGCARSGTCPICKSSLSTIGRAWYWLDKEQKNLDVWNGSYHGVQGFEDYSPICPLCYVALRAYDNAWVRSADNPDSFFLPLDKSISDVPLPTPTDIRYKIVYSQEFPHLPEDTSCTESVSFWCVLRAEAEVKFQSYASEHGLILKIDRRNGESDSWIQVIAYLPNKSLERTRDR